MNKQILPNFLLIVVDDEGCGLLKKWDELDTTRKMEIYAGESTRQAALGTQVCPDSNRT